MVRVIREDADDIVSLERRQRIASIVERVLDEGNSIVSEESASLPYGEREFSKCIGVRNGNGRSDITILTGLVIVTERNRFDLAYKIASEVEMKTGRSYTLLERYAVSVD